MKPERNILINLVIFKIEQGSLKVFLINNQLPSIYWKNENLEKNVKKLFEETTKLPINENYFEQLYTISKDGKIHIVYFALIVNSQNNGWHELKLIEKSNKDYEIINYALQRLRWKIEYTNVVYSLLPKEFSLTELQKVYETILNKKLDKRNFRKKIISLGFLGKTEKKKIISTRPAVLYTFKTKTPTIVKIFS